MTSTALVTGATGFIGSHLIEALLANGWDVTCFTRPKSKTRVLERLPVKIVRGDIGHVSSLEKAVSGQDYIFHVAARIRSAPKKVYNRANVEYTKNLAGASLRKNPGLKRFVFISSIAASGPSSPGKRSDESKTCAPTSEYGRSKLRAERWLKAQGDTLPLTIIRPPNVYGKGQQETELLIKIIKGRVVPILREGTGSTSLIYINDLIDGIILAALSPISLGRTYFLTDGIDHSCKPIILTIKDNLLGTSLFFPLWERLISLAACSADVFNATGVKRIHFGRKIWRVMVHTPWLFSCERAKRDFGFKPVYSLQKGFKDILRHNR